MERTNYTTGAKWEDIVGYSRAVRVGNVIEVAGTTAVSNGEVVAKGSAFGQTRYIFNLIDEVLGNLGSSLEDVVRTRIYVTNIKDWENVGKAHHIFFSKTKPASTLVEVSALIDPELLVEIEVTAIVS
jgi:enamine deaminase RidA (YjgF/YER057c/UK114 family)